jgi:hypothetical protein
MALSKQTIQQKAYDKLKKGESNPKYVETCKANMAKSCLNRVKNEIAEAARWSNIANMPVRIFFPLSVFYIS